ncbi:endonuclease/exonuclease/phosphatase family protein [Brevundimonas variabilis]|uniref:Endonuclease/exonuclease/phosphatase family metal-dependent hydrolase n=1 Tax=Brevundimonas variabilis TaxID=74312 RepID=A0A7W9CID6_9CAUL|nr:endonuclease/exonuclease/phosphatase family protein [Brevundimonas variabilis]MBB5746235.1 endonuclease/exonuclease/phosphatase family metal-dependent hydrolase [Brevundimonas variabilis]
MARIVTYNVHRCVGTDRRLDVARVAAVIAEHEPDIVCLQELDVGRARTGHVDQAAAIARELSMGFRFNAAMRIEAEEYGDAILTAHPEKLIRAGHLPTIRGVPGLEPRGAVWAAIEIGGHTLNVVTTHLGLVPREQRLQAAALLSKDWLGHPDATGPTLLAGDFNATSITRPYQTLVRRLADCQRAFGQKPTLKTFPSGFPAIRIDHVFISPHIRVTGVSVPFSPLARVASDHLPLIVDFEIEG